MARSLLIKRRQFLLSGTAFSLAFLGSAKQSWAQQHPANDAYRDFESSDIPDHRPLGNDPAKSDEVANADKLILGSPQNKRPIDVMLYFESLPDRNGDGEAYNGGWEKRWNPVIVRFFSETRTKPSGDTTAWCAASLNWVLARSGYDGTLSASSGKFRDAPGITHTPHEGDIVVFVRTDLEEARVGHGHVGLFLKQTNDSILVLGGNQKNSNGHHAVCRKWIKKKGDLLTFHSFHAVSTFKQH